MPIPQEKRKYTFADYLSWGEDFSCEIIGGVCYVDGGIFEPFSGRPALMAKPSIRHQRVCRNLMAQLHQYLEGKECEALSEIDVLLPLEGEDEQSASNVCSPDIVVVCDKEKLRENYCLGAPDLAIEILSKSTMRNDKVLKYNLYQRAGIEEYWIVDPDGETVQVFSLQGGAYQPIDLYSKPDIVKVNVLNGCFVELLKVFKD